MLCRQELNGRSPISALALSKASIAKAVVPFDRQGLVAGKDAEFH